MKLTYDYVNNLTWQHIAMLKCEQVNIYIINCDIMLPMPAHAVVHFAISPTYTIHRRIVNTPATAKLDVAE